MRNLEMNEMEQLQGGEVPCQTGLAATAALTAGLVVLTVATGGVAGFAFAAMGAFWGGSVLSIGNCIDTNWS